MRPFREQQPERRKCEEKLLFFQVFRLRRLALPGRADEIHNAVNDTQDKDDKYDVTDADVLHDATFQDF